MQKKEPTLTPQEKVKTLLKRREDKIKSKEDRKNYKNKLHIPDEERDIMNKLKNKKNDKKRERARETDEFDDILNSYKKKVLKKMKKNMVGATDKQIKEGDFEEVEMSD